jgi:hypothetical protein
LATSTQAATVLPLANPGFESGFTSWTARSTNLNVATGTTSVGANTLSPTEGGNWLSGGHLPYTTTSSNVNVGLMYFKQTVDVSDFASIDSVTYGGDFFAAGQILSGSGFVRLDRPTVADMWVKYFNSSGGQLGNTYEFDAPTGPADITTLLLVDDFRKTVTGIPAGTASIEFNAGMSVFVGTDVPGQPISANVLGGMDDMYLAVNGAQVPEPATLGLLAMGAVGLLRRRR